MMKYATKEKVDAYLFVLPALLFFLVFAAFPIVQNAYWSLFRFGLISPKWVFVGLRHYFKLAKNPIFWLSFRNNLIFAIVSVAVQVGVGLIIAAILDKGIKRFRAVFRAIYFLPIMMSFVAVGLVWQFVFNPIFGLLNAFLQSIGLGQYTGEWLGDPKAALPCLLITACWQYTGFPMVIMLAGLQSIPEEIYEAARIEGASEIQCFWFITIPLLSPVIFTAIIITVIGSFKVFDLVYVMTGGGPANATQVLATYMYKNAFTLHQMGYASAIATLLLTFTLVFSVIQLRMSGSLWMIRK